MNNIENTYIWSIRMLHCCSFKGVVENELSGWQTLLLADVQLILYIYHKAFYTLLTNVKV